MITKEKYFRKFYALLILGFVLMLAIGLPLQKRAWRKYTRVTYELELSGKIENTKIDRGYFVKLNDGRRFALPPAENSNYNPPSLSGFYKYGDSIIKPPFSDTIFIKRNDKRYFFILKTSYWD
jgi:hypothetical protein